MYFHPKVLFVCTYRGGRSQIAAQLAKSYASDVFDCDCACFDPGTISKDFVSLIDSLGITIQSASPPSVFELAKMGEDYEYVVCLCKGVGTEMCALFRKNIEKIFPNSIDNIHWDIPDFTECNNVPGKDFKTCVEEICEEIKRQVKSLSLKIQNATKS